MLRLYLAYSREIDTFNKKVIICVGRLTRQKKFLDVIHAIKNLEQDLLNTINLVILGEGEQRELIEKEIHDDFLLLYESTVINNCILH